MLLTLWTVRPESDYFLLKEKGIYKTDERFVDAHRLQAYYWMSEQLNKKIVSPKNVTLPVWAWYRAHGLKSPKPDLRRKGHLISGERGVRIEFVVPDNLVLLSNFDGWHAVLNNHCFAINDEEYEYYEQLEQTCSEQEFQIIKQKSWQKIFALNLLPDANIYEVQANLWELKLDWITKVDFFIAK